MPFQIALDRPHPSLVWPTSFASGLQTLVVGILLCFVRSKMNIVALGDMVAIMSGFCGMYRALLTSPSCGIFCVI